MKTKTMPSTYSPQAAALRVARTQHAHPVLWEVGASQTCLEAGELLGEEALRDLISQAFEEMGGASVRVRASNPETGAVLTAAHWTSVPEAQGAGVEGAAGGAGSELASLLVSFLREPQLLEQTVGAVTRPLRGDVSEKEAAISFGEVARLVLREELPVIMRAQLEAAVSAAFERAAPAIAKTVQVAVDRRIGSRVIASGDQGAQDNPALLELGLIGPDGSPELLETLAAIAGVDAGPDNSGVWSAMGDAAACERLRAVTIAQDWILAAPVSVVPASDTVDARSKTP